MSLFIKNLLFSSIVALTFSDQVIKDLQLYLTSKYWGDYTNNLDNLVLTFNSVCLHETTHFLDEKAFLVSAINAISSNSITNMYRVIPSYQKNVDNCEPYLYSSLLFSEDYHDKFITMYEKIDDEKRKNNINNELLTKMTKLKSAKTDFEKKIISPGKIEPFISIWKNVKVIEDKVIKSSKTSKPVQVIEDEELPFIVSFWKNQVIKSSTTSKPVEVVKDAEEVVEDVPWIVSFWKNQGIKSSKTSKPIQVLEDDEEVVQDEVIKSSTTLKASSSTTSTTSTTLSSTTLSTTPSSTTPSSITLSTTLSPIEEVLDPTDVSECVLSINESNLSKEVPSACLKSDIGNSKITINKVENKKAKIDIIYKTELGTNNNMRTDTNLICSNAQIFYTLNSVEKYFCSTKSTISNKNIISGCNEQIDFEYILQEGDHKLIDPVLSFNVEYIKCTDIELPIIEGPPDNNLKPDNGIKQNNSNIIKFYSILIIFV